MFQYICIYIINMDMTSANMDVTGVNSRQIEQGSDDPEATLAAVTEWLKRTAPSRLPLLPVDSRAFSPGLIAQVLSPSKSIYPINLYH